MAMIGITHMRVVTQKLDIKAEIKRMHTKGTNDHDSYDGFCCHGHHDHRYKLNQSHIS